jgi:tetratricopeptide (TPR) repeat protein
MDSHPNNYLVAYASGLSHIQEKQFDDAIAAFEAAIQIFPYCEEAYYNLGAVYKSKFNTPKAVAAFRKTIEVGDPHDVFVKHASSNLKDLERIIFENYRLPIDTYIKSHELFNQGFDAMREKRHEQAIDLFTASLAISENHPQCHSNIGICHARLGRKDEALKAFTRALKIDPNYEPAIVNMNVVEQLKEGEALPSDEMRVTEYYREYTAQNKSYIQSLLNAEANRDL